MWWESLHGEFCFYRQIMTERSYTKTGMYVYMISLHVPKPLTDKHNHKQVKVGG